MDGKNFRIFRQAHRRTVIELAQRTGMSLQILCCFERGQVDLVPKTVEQLIAAIEVLSRVKDPKLHKRLKKFCRIDPEHLIHLTHVGCHVA